MTTSKTNISEIIPKTELPQPTSGKWDWKDDGNCLEFISVIKKDTKKRAEKHRAADRGITPSRNKKPAIKTMTYKRKEKENLQSHVTLSHVKALALDSIRSAQSGLERFEAGLYHTEQLDVFLMYLLNYFQLYFEKLKQDNKPNPMNIEPSQKEVDHIKKVEEKLLAAQKLVGHSYGILILGYGIDEHHHMSCGKSRVSNTDKDREMYECLYKFCTFLVWITFERRDHDAVKKEVNRMLRSDTFNPALRTSIAAANKEPKLTPAQYRRQHGNRPAIKSIVNQKSPALISILPSSKEDATYLFQRKKPLFATPITKKTTDEIATDDTMNSAANTLNLENLKIGVIGADMKDINPATLMPRKAGEEEDPQEKEKERLASRRASQQLTSESPLSRYHPDEIEQIDGSNLKKELTQTTQFTQNEKNL